MRTQEILLRKPQTLCSFEGECTFKKLNNTGKNAAAKRATCTWRGNCNQQNPPSKHPIWETAQDD